MRLLMLLCRECHRFHSIAVLLSRRGIDVLHVFDDEAIETTDLERSIEDGTDYLCYDLTEVIEELTGKASWTGLPTVPKALARTGALVFVEGGALSMRKRGPVKTSMLGVSLLIALG